MVYILRCPFDRMRSIKSNENAELSFVVVAFVVLFMDSLWKEALREHHDSVVSAIRDEVIMQRLLDHLYSNKCIEDEHKELVRNEKTSRARANCLLDILKTQTEKVFHELCNALDNITIDAHQTLAQSLRQSLNKMQVKECQRIRGKASIGSAHYSCKLG